MESYTRNNEVFFNEFFSAEKMIQLINAIGINVSLNDEFYDVYNNCSFLANDYEYDMICKGSDILDLHAAVMFSRFMKSL